MLVKCNFRYKYLICIFSSSFGMKKNYVDKLLGIGLNIYLFIILDLLEYFRGVVITEIEAGERECVNETHFLFLIVHFFLDTLLVVHCRKLKLIHLLPCNYKF